jgi:hypothetical protein
MTLDEFLRLVASETPLTVERDVRINAPELLEDLRRRGGMMLTDFVADPRHTFERRTLRYGHVLGPGLPRDAVDDWSRRWPHHPLPVDLVDLLTRANGIHLWADLDTGRSYEGLAPLEEWELARTRMFGAEADPTLLSDRYLALSYYANRDRFVVLNVESGRYLDMDPCGGADEGSLIGAEVGDLMDWLWRRRRRPEPPQL